MTLEELKKLNAKRTSGKWTHRESAIKDYIECDRIPIAASPNNLKFIAAAANSMDALLAIASAVQSMWDRQTDYQCRLAMEDVKKALETLYLADGG